MSTAGVYCLAPLARPFVARFTAGDRSDESSLTSQRISRFEAAGDGSASEKQAEQVPVAEGFVRTALSTNETAVEQDRSPAALGIRLVLRGDVAPSWGIVCRQSEYFMMDGLPVDRLEAGKLIDYRSTHYSSQGAMVEFMFDSPAGIPTTPYLMSQTNLILFTGNYSELSTQQVRDLKACYAVGETTPAARAQPVRYPPRGVQLALRGDVKPGWGVVRQQTNRYTADGRWMGSVAAGSLIDYVGTVSSSKGAMVGCLLCTTNERSSVRSLISQKDLHLFTGSYRSLSDKQVKDLRAYYELAGKIALRRNELLQASAAKNPFFPDYQAAYRVLMTNIDKARGEVILRDHAAGAEKVQAQERLSDVRMEQRRLLLKYDEVEGKFKDWKKEHAAELQSPDDDADIRQMTKLKRTLAPAIPELAF